MLKKFNRNIGVKTFCFIFFLLSVSSGLIYCLMMILIPNSYQIQLDQAAEAAFIGLNKQFNEKGIDKDLIEDYCKEYGATVTLTDKDNSIIQTWGSEKETDFAKKNDGKDSNQHITISAVEDDGNPYYLTATLSNDSVNYVNKAIFKMLPYVIGVICLLSAVGGYLAYRFISKPMIKLSNQSIKLANLDFSDTYEIKNKDELGTLSRNLNQLANKLSKTLEELKGTNERLLIEIDKEKSRKIQQRQFFSAVSHELKTPITLIRCLLDGMIHKIGKYEDRDVYLEKTQASVFELEMLVSEIMTLSKLDMEQDSLNLKQIDLSAMIKNYLYQNEMLFESKQMVVKSEIENNLRIYADEELLRKVVSNLINNAISYSPKGAALIVKLRLENNKGINLEITNTGVSISQTQLKELFEPFKRIEESRNRNSGGSGLGLYIVKTILEKHEFPYQLLSNEDSVTFKVFFPS